MRKLLIDTKTGRPGCVLLQAVAGCHANNEFLSMTFDTKDWLLAPTPDMAIVSGTDEQWQKLAAKLKNRKEN